MSATIKTHPCLIVGYSRLAGTMRVVEAASRNGCTKIYLNLDGPRDQPVFAIQEQIEAAFRNICEDRNIKYEIRRLPNNLGLKKAVISAIDWFFESESEGFIFEDDLEISDLFFQYTDLVHCKFQTDSKILLISGNQFEKNHGHLSPMLSVYPLIWGWFTNSEKWNYIKRLIAGEKLLQKNKLPLSVVMFWKIGALESRFGFLNSWAVPFAEGFRSQGYLCIVPSVNLVSNIGTDRFAAHTNVIELENSYPIDKIGGTTLLSNKINWNYLQQDPTYLEKNVYRIKAKHSLLWIKLPLIYIKRLLKKKSLDGN